jgi:hypothetical protein
MTKDEALKLALEARRIADEYKTPDSQVDSGNLYFALMKCLEFIEAQPDHIVDANKMAQPAQEPVFKWHSVFQEMPVENSHLLFCFGVHVVEGSYTKNGWASLSYGSAQPDFWAYFPPPPHHRRNQELYAMPPQRPWIGLTEQDHNDLEDYCEMIIGKPAFEAIEAKLKEKNT